MDSSEQFSPEKNKFETPPKRDKEAETAREKLQEEFSDLSESEKAKRVAEVLDGDSGEGDKVEKEPQEKGEEKVEAEKERVEKSIKPGDKVYWQRRPGERSSELTVEHVDPQPDESGVRWVEVKGDSRRYPLDEIEPAEESSEDEPSPEEEGESEEVEPVKESGESEPTPEEFADDPEVEAMAAEYEEMSPEEREEASWGLWNIGHKVEELKGKAFKNLYKKPAEYFSKRDDQSTLARWFSSLNEQFEEKEKRAHEAMVETKEEAEEKGVGAKIMAQGKDKWMLAANGLKLAGMAVSPRRWWMVGGLTGSSWSEAAKEARFKDQELIEGTRFEDAEAAAEEAWNVYERAEKMSGGDSEVTKALLEQAYMESIPESALERLEESDVQLENLERNVWKESAKPTTEEVSAEEIQDAFSKKEIQDALSTEGLQAALKKLFEDPTPGKGTAFIQEICKKHIEDLAKKANDAFLEIDMNDSLSEEEKAQKKQEWLDNHDYWGHGDRAHALKDYDRMLTQQGAVDWWALTAQKGERVGKAVVAAAMVDALYKTVHRMPEAITRTQDYIEGARDYIDEAAGKASDMFADARDYVGGFFGGEEVASEGAEVESTDTEEIEDVDTEDHDSLPGFQTEQEEVMEDIKDGPDADLDTESQAVAEEAAERGLEAATVNEITTEDYVTNSVEQMAEDLKGEEVVFNEGTSDEIRMDSINQDMLYEALDHEKSVAELSDGTEVPLRDLHLVHEGDQLELQVTQGPDGEPQLYFELNAESGETPGSLEALYEAQKSEGEVSDWVLQNMHEQQLESGDVDQGIIDEMQQRGLETDTAGEEELPTSSSAEEVSGLGFDSPSLESDLSGGLSSHTGVMETERAAGLLLEKPDEAEGILKGAVHSYLEFDGEPPYADRLNMPEGMTEAEFKGHISSLDTKEDLMKNLDAVKKENPDQYEALQTLYESFYHYQTDPDVEATQVTGNRQKYRALYEYVHSDNIDIFNEGATAEKAASSGQEVEFEVNENEPTQDQEAAAEETAETSPEFVDEKLSEVIENPTRNQMESLLEKNSDLGKYPRNLAASLYTAVDSPDLNVGEGELDTLVSQLANSKKPLLSNIEQMKNDGAVDHLTALSEIFSYHLEDLNTPDTNKINLGLDISKEEIETLDNFVENQLKEIDDEFVKEVEVNTGDASGVAEDSQPVPSPVDDSTELEEATSETPDQAGAETETGSTEDVFEDVPEIDAGKSDEEIFSIAQENFSQGEVFTDGDKAYVRTVDSSQNMQMATDKATSEARGILAEELEMSKLESSHVAHQSVSQADGEHQAEVLVEVEASE